MKKMVVALCLVSAYSFAIGPAQMKQAVVSGLKLKPKSNIIKHQDVEEFVKDQFNLRNGVTPLDDFVYRQINLRIPGTVKLFEPRSFKSIKADFDTHTFTGIKNDDAFVTDFNLSHGVLEVRTTVYQNGRFFDTIQPTTFSNQGRSTLVIRATDKEVHIDAYNGDMYFEAVLAFEKNGNPLLTVTNLRGNPEVYGTRGSFRGPQAMKLVNFDPKHGSKIKVVNGKFVTTSGNEVVSEALKTRYIRNLLEAN